MTPESKREEEEASASEQQRATTPLVSLDTPCEISKDEYRNLIKQIQSDFSKSECQDELLDAARYNDIDVARALLYCHPDLHAHQSSQGKNTALHMAAANGHTDLVQLLLHAGADASVVNEAGNTPLHWAATNGQNEVVEILLQQKNTDVLQRNQFGRSALTEGFTSENATVIKRLLEHESASEERLIETSGNGSAMNKSSDTENDGENDVTDSVTHDFLFGSDDDQSSSFHIRARERAIAKSEKDSILGQENAEEDTTGLGIWAASLVAAQWMAAVVNPKSFPEVRSVLELGAGCGLPSLVIAAALPQAVVYATDFNKETVANLQHNLELNNPTVDRAQLSAAAKALLMNWQDSSTWPSEKIDLIVGSDLIYQTDMVPLLVQTIQGLLKHDVASRFLYTAPISGRQGQDEFFTQMKGSFRLVSQREAPLRYTKNPLKSQDDEECFLHFHELASTTFVLYEFQWK